MKEDVTGNELLKPSYKLQHEVNSEHITWLDTSARPADTRSLIPFLKDKESYLLFKYQKIIANTGYENEKKKSLQTQRQKEKETLFRYCSRNMISKLRKISRMP